MSITKLISPGHTRRIVFRPKNVNALNSLGTLLYSQGATTLKTDAEKAKVEFKEAKEYLEKLIPLLSPSKPAQKKMIDNANTMLNFINTIAVRAGM